MLATDTLQASTNLFGVVTDQAGSNNAGTPRWVVNDPYGTYTLGPATVTLQGRYISPGIFDATKYGPDQTGYVVNNTNCHQQQLCRGRVLREHERQLQHHRPWKSSGFSCSARSTTCSIRNAAERCRKTRLHHQPDLLRSDRPLLQDRPAVQLLS